MQEVLILTKQLGVKIYLFCQLVSSYIVVSIVLLAGVVNIALLAIIKQI